MIVLIGPKSDHWLPLSVTNSMTNSLTHSLTAVWKTWLTWFWPLKMPTQNFLMLLVLLMLMLRKVLKTVWSRFGSWGLVEFWYLFLVTILKLKFGQDFEVYFWSRLWGWDLIKILRLKFVRDFVAEDWSTFWAINLVKIWKLKFGQDSEARLVTCYFGESTQPLGPLCLWQCLCETGSHEK